MKERPKLHRDYLAAVTAKNRTKPKGETMRTKNGPGAAIEQFEAAVAAKVNAGMTRHAATAAVVKADPDLHKRYLNEYNANAGRPKALRS